MDDSLAWRSMSDDPDDMTRQFAKVVGISLAAVPVLGCAAGTLTGDSGLAGPAMAYALVIPALALFLCGWDWWRDRGRIVEVRFVLPDRVVLRRVDGHLLTHPASAVKALEIIRYRGREKSTTLWITVDGQRLVTRPGRPDVAAERALSSALLRVGGPLAVVRESHGD
ncbi:hypothetical protein AB0M43_03665 [Longispora sp. NPDC051575]|uniref:hypothetical protein n=1 Tax=Longispora sp. NPDC051575 TaxID=3154943 RepID=UPI00343827E4